MNKREKAKDARLRREYNITLEHYNKVLKLQGGVCAICKRKYNKKGELMRLNVDHDHTSGQVRGIICYLCNKAIAIFQNNSASMANAALYITKTPFEDAFGKKFYTAPGKVGSKARKKKLSKMRLNVQT
jgi:hypothetical protein